MKELDIKKLEEAFIIYNGLTEKERNLVKKQNDKIWNEACNKFLDLCAKDSALLEADKSIKKFKETVSYNANNHFEEHKERGDYFRIFTKINTKYETEKYITENFDQLTQEINMMINKLKTKKIVINRQKKISVLESQLKDYRKAKNHFEEHLRKKEAREVFLQKEDVLYKKPKEVYEKKTAKYANKVVVAMLEKRPELICEEKRIIYFNPDKKYFDLRVMNNTLNSIRDQVVRNVVKNVENENIEEKE